MSNDTMPDQPGSDENIFIEIDGEKFKANPEDPTKALMGEDDKPIPFEEKAEETEDEKKERLKKEKEQKKEEDKDPPIRKSAKDHIIDRKNRKIEKLKKEKEKEGKDDDDDDDDDDFGEEFTKEGKKLIDKKIGKALKPLLQQVRTQTDDQELNDLFDKKGTDGKLMYPDARGMEKQIRKYMVAYPKASIEFIYLGLMATKMRLATKKKEADDEAAADVTGGHSRRKGVKPKIPDVTKMGDKELGELVHKVKTGQF